MFDKGTKDNSLSYISLTGVWRDGGTFCVLSRVASQLGGHDEIKILELDFLQ